uniref:Uncharacterized protein n=1 Tax=Moumouvirus sp. 'Monve' TaxID=1128131 RepID=H2EFE5_9VIRU|nr:hypothetical protein mv_L1008 [Moumouvirus Monve]
MIHICGEFEYSCSYRNNQRIRKIYQKKLFGIYFVRYIKNICDY